MGEELLASPRMPPPPDQSMSLFSKSLATGLVFGAAGAIAPALLFFVPRSTTAVAVAAALTGLGFTLWRGDRPRPLERPFALLFIGVCIWAALTVTWSLDTHSAAWGVLKLSGNLALGAVLFGVARRLTEPESRVAERALVGGFAGGVGLVTLEWLSDGVITRLIAEQPGSTEEFRGILSIYGLFWLNACVSLLLVLYWPVAMVLRRSGKTLLAALLFAAAAAAAYGVGYTTGIMALACGLATAAAVYAFRRWAGRAMACVLVAGTLAAPLLPVTVLKPRSDVSMMDRFPTGMVHRLFIWEFTAKRIAEHPVRGWGMDASRIIPGGKEHVMTPVRRFGKIYDQRSLGSVMPLHPHNLALQLWLELGAPGALSFCALVTMLVLRLTQPGLGRDAPAFACGQLATCLIMSSVSYGAWQSWWLATLWLGASFTAIAWPSTASQRDG